MGGYPTASLCAANSSCIQIEELLAEEALQEGDDFTVGRFFDDFYAAGIIPTVLVRWEMTGEKDSILDVDEVQEAPWR